MLHLELSRLSRSGHGSGPDSESAIDGEPSAASHVWPKSVSKLLPESACLAAQIPKAETNPETVGHVGPVLNISWSSHFVVNSLINDQNA